MFDFTLSTLKNVIDQTHFLLMFLRIEDNWIIDIKLDLSIFGKWLNRI